MTIVPFLFCGCALDKEGILEDLGGKYAARGLLELR